MTAPFADIDFASVTGKCLSGLTVYGNECVWSRPTRNVMRYAQEYIALLSNPHFEVVGHPFNYTASLKGTKVVFWRKLFVDGQPMHIDGWDHGLQRAAHQEAA